MICEIKHTTTNQRQRVGSVFNPEGVVLCQPRVKPWVTGEPQLGSPNGAALTAMFEFNANSKTRAAPLGLQILFHTVSQGGAPVGRLPWADLGPPLRG